MRVLVIGCGSIGKRHLENLNALGCDALFACDTQQERLAHARAAGVRTSTCLEDALAWGPDAALVCTSTSSHIPIARPLAEAGCHLFIEKPLSHSMEGVTALLEACRSRNLTLMVGYSLRFHPGLKRVRSFLEEGRLGRIYSVQAECGQYLPDWHPWEDYRHFYMAREAAGGGATLDISHEIDYLRHLFGEVRELACFMGTVSDLEIDTDDLSEMLFRHEGGVFTHLHLDLLQRAYARSCKVVGEKGTLVWDYPGDAIRSFEADRYEWVEENYEHDRNAVFLDELRRFLDCAREGAPPPVDGEDARRTLEVVLAAKRAARARRVVHL